MNNDLIHNSSFIAPFISWILAQSIKPLISLISGESFDIKRSLSTGGMPSSHTSTVVALTTNLAIIFGIGSYQFAIAMVFSSIVIYDAMGIRQEAGKQAEMINSWSTTLGELFEGQFSQTNLKTMLGHTISQVLFGILLGLIVGFVVTYLIGF
ncbi:MAG: divergent PAP2 family protein [Spirochaetaceae bacterium]|nr:divergent PAP2 family protein [Spirochaetaceae bacterium]